jgi:flagellar assembly protein FliH
MDDVIPKEKLTAYERWELAAFDEAHKAGPAPTPLPTAAGKAPSPPPAATPDQAAALRTVTDEARSKGFAEGREAGYAEGMKAARAMAERMTRLAEAFDAALRQSETALAQDVLDLSLAVARQIVRTNLAVRPELLLAVISEAMAMVPSHHGHPTLVLHPADAAMLHEALGQQMAHTGWRVVEDGALQRGDLRVESTNSELDATLKARWAAVVDAIGTRVDWIGDGDA